MSPSAYLSLWYIFQPTELQYVTFLTAFSIVTIDLISPIPALVNSSLTKSIGSMHLPIINSSIAHCTSFKVNSALIFNFAFCNLCLQRSFTTPSNSFKSDLINIFLNLCIISLRYSRMIFCESVKHFHFDPILSERFELILEKASF